MSKKPSVSELLENANSHFIAERKNMSEKHAMAVKHKRKVRMFVKRYAEPFKDGFQLSDLGVLAGITQELIMYVDDLVKLKSEEKHQLVVSCVMMIYAENYNKLPWYLRWVPKGMIEKIASSSAQGMFNYLRKKQIL